MQRALPGTAGTAQVNTVQFQLESLVQGGTTAAVFGPDSNFVKGCWNHAMLESDGSKGGHNPEWLPDIIAATVSNIGL